jgi:hypothetical protein
MLRKRKTAPLGEPSLMTSDALKSSGLGSAFGTSKTLAVPMQPSRNDPYLALTGRLVSTSGRNRSRGS